MSKFKCPYLGFGHAWNENFGAIATKFYIFLFKGTIKFLSLIFEIKKLPNKLNVPFTQIEKGRF